MEPVPLPEPVALARLAPYGREALVFSGYVEAEAALPDAPAERIDSLPALDRALARHKPRLLVAELPSRLGEAFVDPVDLVRFLRNTRTALFLASDLSPAELGLPVNPDFLYVRHFVPDRDRRDGLLLEGHGSAGCKMHTRTYPALGRSSRNAQTPVKPSSPPGFSFEPYEQLRVRDTAACFKLATALARMGGLAVRHLGLHDHPAHKSARRSLHGYGSRFHVAAVSGSISPDRIARLLADAGLPATVRAAVAARGDAFAVDFADLGKEPMTDQRPSNDLHFPAVDLAGMEAVADRIVERSPAGTVVAMTGELGAGKTHLARLLLRRLGHFGRAASPSYIICNQFRTPEGATLSHLDFYRVREFRELLDLGLEEILADSRLAIVEWAERFERELADLAPVLVVVRIAIRPDGLREITLTSAKGGA